MAFYLCVEGVDMKCTVSLSHWGSTGFVLKNIFYGLFTIYWVYAFHFFFLILCVLVPLLYKNKAHNIEYYMFTLHC
jgi:drug/metabolite transporter (DMT)-like permease